MTINPDGVFSVLRALPYLVDYPYVGSYKPEARRLLKAELERVQMEILGAGGAAPRARPAPIAWATIAPVGLTGSSDLWVTPARVPRRWIAVEPRRLPSRPVGFRLPRKRVPDGESVV